MFAKVMVRLSGMLDFTQQDSGLGHCSGFIRKYFVWRCLLRLIFVITQTRCLKLTNSDQEKARV